MDWAPNSVCRLGEELLSRIIQNFACGISWFNPLHLNKPTPLRLRHESQRLPTAQPVNEEISSAQGKNDLNVVSLRKVDQSRICEFRFIRGVPLHKSFYPFRRFLAEFGNA